VNCRAGRSANGDERCRPIEGARNRHEEIPLRAGVGRKKGVFHDDPNLNIARRRCSVRLIDGTACLEAMRMATSETRGTRVVPLMVHACASGEAVRCASPIERGITAR